jgi:hypothetical protein
VPWKNIATFHNAKVAISLQNINLFLRYESFQKIEKGMLEPMEQNIVSILSFPFSPLLLLLT